MTGLVVNQLVIRGDGYLSAYHAVDALAGLGKYQFLDPPLTRPACKAMSVVRFVSGHDSFFCDGLLADKALEIRISASVLS